MYGCVVHGFFYRSIYYCCAIIDGGPGNAEVVTAIKSLGITCVRGNHDFGELFNLSPELCSYLAGLPDSIIENGCIFTHISPRKKQTKIKDEYEAWNVFDDTKFRIIFVGHVHVPLVFGSDSGLPTSAKSIPVKEGVPIRLNKDFRYVICVGAVGYPRDGVRRPRFGIFDDVDGTIEIRSTDGPVLDLG